MADPTTFRTLIDQDLLALKFLLKSKVASFDNIKKEEEQLIDSIKKVIVQVKDMERVLEQEISLFKTLAGGWEKAYVEKRWNAIGQTIRAELDNFNQEYSKTKDLYDQCQSLHQRLDKLVTLLKSMNAKNKESRDKELTLLDNFRKRKDEK
jgi:hypothetical protein